MKKFLIWASVIATLFIMVFSWFAKLDQDARRYGADYIGRVYIPDSLVLVMNHRIEFWGSYMTDPAVFSLHGSNCPPFVLDYHNESCLVKESIGSEHYSFRNKVVFGDSIVYDAHVLNRNKMDLSLYEDNSQMCLKISDYTDNLHPHDNLYMLKADFRISFSRYWIDRLLFELRYRMALCLMDRRYEPQLDSFDVLNRKYPMPEAPKYVVKVGERYYSLSRFDDNEAFWGLYYYPSVLSATLQLPDESLFTCTEGTMYSFPDSDMDLMESFVYDGREHYFRVLSDSTITVSPLMPEEYYADVHIVNRIIQAYFGTMVNNGTIINS